MGLHRAEPSAPPVVRRLAVRLATALFVAALLLPLAWSVDAATEEAAAATRPIEGTALAAQRVEEAAPVSRSTRRRDIAPLPAHPPMAVPTPVTPAPAPTPEPTPTPTPTPEPTPTPTPEPAPEPTPMAATDDLLLVVPAAPGDEAFVGFHQASAGRGARNLAPHGEQLVMPDALSPDDEAAGVLDGHAHVVMASRGRGTAATTAVDVAVAEDTEVVAPVTGEVETVATYALYGRTRDVMIVIRPDDAPDLAVTLFHVTDPVVEDGDHVEAGRTPLATVRLLPFGSQIDRFTGDDRPHVHVEVRAR